MAKTARWRRVRIGTHNLVWHDGSSRCVIPATPGAEVDRSQVRGQPVQLNSKIANKQRAGGDLCGRDCLDMCEMLGSIFGNKKIIPHL